MPGRPLGAAPAGPDPDRPWLKQAVRVAPDLKTLSNPDVKRRGNSLVPPELMALMGGSSASASSTVAPPSSSFAGSDTSSNPPGSMSDTSRQYDVPPHLRGSSAPRAQPAPAPMSWGAPAAAPPPSAPAAEPSRGVESWGSSASPAVAEWARTSAVAPPTASSAPVDAPWGGASSTPAGSSSSRAPTYASAAIQQPPAQPQPSLMDEDATPPASPAPVAAAVPKRAPSSSIALDSSRIEGAGMSLTGWLASRERSKLIATLAEAHAQGVLTVAPDVKGERATGGDACAKLVQALTFAQQMGKIKAPEGSPDGLWLGSRNAEHLGKLAAIAAQRQRTGYIRNDAGFLEIGELYDFDPELTDAIRPFVPKVTASFLMLSFPALAKTLPGDAEARRDLIADENDDRALAAEVEGQALLERSIGVLIRQLCGQLTTRQKDDIQCLLLSKAIHFALWRRIESALTPVELPEAPSRTEQQELWAWLGIGLEDGTARPARVAWLESWLTPIVKIARNQILVLDSTELFDGPSAAAPNGIANGHQPAAQSHASSTRGSSGLPKPSTYADDFLNGLQVGSAEWSKIVHGGAASTSDLGASVIGALLSLIIVFLATLSPTVHAFARSLRPPSEPMFGSRALAFVGGLHGWTQGRDDQQAVYRSDLLAFPALASSELPVTASARRINREAVSTRRYLANEGLTAASMSRPKPGQGRPGAIIDPDRPWLRAPHAPIRDEIRPDAPARAARGAARFKPLPGFEHLLSSSGDTSGGGSDTTSQAATSAHAPSESGSATSPPASQTPIAPVSSTWGAAPASTPSAAAEPAGWSSGAASSAPVAPSPQVATTWASIPARPPSPAMSERSVVSSAPRPAAAPRPGWGSGSSRHARPGGHTLAAAPVSTTQASAPPSSWGAPNGSTQTATTTSSPAASNAGSTKLHWGHRDEDEDDEPPPPRRTVTPSPIQQQVVPPTPPPSVPRLAPVEVEAVEPEPASAPSTPRISALSLGAPVSAAAPPAPSAPASQASDVPWAHLINPSAPAAQPQAPSVPHAQTNGYAESPALLTDEAVSNLRSAPVARVRESLFNGTNAAVDNQGIQAALSADDLIRRFAALLGYAVSVLLFAFASVSPAFASLLDSTAKPSSSGQGTKLVGTIADTLGDAAEWARGGSDAGLRRRVGGAVNVALALVDGKADSTSSGGGPNGAAKRAMPGVSR